MYTYDMKTSQSSESRHHRLRETYLRELRAVGMFMEGTLSKVQRANRKSPSWQLTFKQAGKTRTIYVPVDLAPEVQRWVKEHKRLKQVIRKVTAQNLAVIRRHAAVRRAEKRGRLPTPPASAKP